MQAQENASVPALAPMTRRTTRRSAAASGSAPDQVVNALSSGAARLSAVAEDVEGRRGAPSHEATKKGVNRGAGGNGTKSRKKGV